MKTTDIKSAFLQGKRLERDVYLTPPKEAHVKENNIWKLKHCLYGLNDAARQFYHSIQEELIKLGCIKSSLDPALFFVVENKQLIGMLASHIDDFLHAGEIEFDQNIMDKMRTRFLAGKLEEGHFGYVGFEIIQHKECIFVDQSGLEVPH